MTRSDATDRLLDRFRTELRDLAPVAVWAHGSLGGGDYQEGRSDLDLIVVLDDPITARTVWRVARLHARLRAEPLVAKLHCSYLTPGTAAGAERRHLTWAHEQLFKRTVTPVTRRELHTFGLVLHGEPPGSCCRRCRTTNSPSSSCGTSGTSGGGRWTGPTTGRRTSGWTWDWSPTPVRLVTLKDGRLITKREALDLLPGLGAPVEVVEDVRRRRYEEPGAPAPVPAQEWAARRAELTRGYLGPAIDRLVAAYE
jgi:hypothetical protein